jgi:hypothetical protein
MGLDEDLEEQLAAVAARQRYLRWVNASLAVALPYGRADDFGILCECGHGDCSDWITLTVEAYEAARRQSSWYMVAPGHEDFELETVKRRYPTYTVVESLGDPPNGSDNGSRLPYGRARRPVDQTKGPRSA